MANAVRGGLTADLGQDVERSILVLLAWAAVAWASLYLVLGRAR